MQGRRLGARDVGPSREDAFGFGIVSSHLDSVYESCLLASVGRGIADINAGRFATSVDDAFAKAAELRKHH